MIKIDLELPESEILYYPQFLSVGECDKYFRHFREKVPWQQDYIKVFGKVYPQPRLTCLYSMDGKPYSYSNITMLPRNFSKELEQLKRKIEDLCQIEFSGCLLNLYRDGNDSNGWHADNEKELGINPVIASLSLGQERYFHLRHRNDKTLKHKMALKNGSLLLMRGETQHKWLHQIPKTAKTVGERINLTFRVIH